MLYKIQNEGLVTLPTPTKVIIEYIKLTMPIIIPRNNHILVKIGANIIIPTTDGISDTAVILNSFANLTFFLKIKLTM